MKTGILTKKIEALIYDDPIPRDYIGASSIGDDCWRKIWYELKGAKRDKPTNKIQRTWDLGKLVELFVIGLLKKSGVEFVDYQVEGTDKDLPYFKGHFDGFMVTPYGLLEVKSAKDSSFRQFVKHGLKRWSPPYYAQIQAYMGMFGVDRGYIIVFNKDTSEFHDELVEFDPDVYDQLKTKARLIYEAPIEPGRVNNNPMWFQCKMCSYRTICHGKGD